MRGKDVKIKLSKSEWLNAGIRAGWLNKESQTATETTAKPKPCSRCKGTGFINQRIRNLGTLDYRDSIEVCDQPGCKKGLMVDPKAFYRQIMMLPNPEDEEVSQQLPRGDKKS